MIANDIKKCKIMFFEKEKFVVSVCDEDDLSSGYDRLEVSLYNEMGFHIEETKPNKYGQRCWVWRDKSGLDINKPTSHNHAPFDVATVDQYFYHEINDKYVKPRGWSIETLENKNIGRFEHHKQWMVTVYDGVGDSKKKICHTIDQHVAGAGCLAVYGAIILSRGGEVEELREV